MILLVLTFRTKYSHLHLQEPVYLSSLLHY
jgi:hypothetical protein